MSEPSYRVFSSVHIHPLFIRILYIHNIHICTCINFSFPHRWVFFFLHTIICNAITGPAIHKHHQQQQQQQLHYRVRKQNVSPRNNCRGVSRLGGSFLHETRPYTYTRSTPERIFSGAGKRYYNYRQLRYNEKAKCIYTRYIQNESENKTQRGTQQEKNKKGRPLWKEKKKKTESRKGIILWKVSRIWSLRCKPSSHLSSRRTKNK